jgi:hypothetical protein
MASVRVHFSPGFPLGGGFPAMQFAPGWWYETAGGEERLLRQVAQQNEAPPARWRRMFRRELLRRYLELRREGNKLSSFSPAVFEICRAPRVFLYRFVHFPVVMVRDATLIIYLTKNLQNLLPMFYFPQSKIEYRWSKNCSAGNSPPSVNPGLKCTRTDAILK